MGKCHLLGGGGGVGYMVVSCRTGTHRMQEDGKEGDNLCIFLLNILNIEAGFPFPF